MKKITTLLVFSVLYNISVSQINWTILTGAPTTMGRYDDIFFLNDHIGWAADGGEGIVYKTTDGGVNWVQQFHVPLSYFRNIEFLNQDIGFLGTLEGQLYRTADGGSNWDLVTISPNPLAICGLDAVGTSTVYGCGAYFSPACVIKSIDSGVTWEYIDMSAYANGLVEVLFVDELLGYASGKNNTGGIVLKTVDGGANWTEIYNSHTPGDYVWKLQLLENNTHIYGSIQSNVTGRLIKSTDEGQTWETKPFVDKAVQAVGFISPDHGWMGGHQSGFYETKDGGDTWTSLGIGSKLNRIFVISPNLAYASGTSLYKFGYSTLSTGETEDVQVKSDLPVTIAPNPFSDRLNIIIDFQHTDNLVAELYDMNGHLLQQLVRDKIDKAETKKYSFDFPYAAGTYTIDIHTNNGRRSLVVVKL